MPPLSQVTKVHSSCHATFVTSHKVHSSSQTTFATTVTKFTPYRRSNWPKRPPLRIGNSIPYVYVHIKRAHHVDMELRPWHNIRINLSQNKPNQRSLSKTLEFLENFEI